MGLCCCKKEKKEDYEFRQVEKLKEKVQAYSDGKINRYNIVRNISFGMREVAKKRLSGLTKKQIVVETILELLDPNAFPQEIAKKIVENTVEDIYTSFTKIFKTSKCCSK